MTDVLIKRELLERIARKFSVKPYWDSMNQGQAIAELRAILAAPRQPEGEGLEVVGWYHSHAEVTTSDKARVVQWLPECVEPLCRLSDAQRAIAELREECERLRAQLLVIFSAEPGRHNIEWAKAMAATGSNEAYAKWREAFDQRDKLAGLLREVRVIVAREVERWTRSAAIFPVNANIESGLLTRIDAALAEVKP